MNGTRVQFGSDPVMYKGSNLVPLREIAEALGAKLTFNSDAGAIRVSKDKYKMTLTIGSKTVYYNGKKDTISTAPVVMEGVTYVPAQVFARGLGAGIVYNANTETLKLTIK
ncbi:copper amine oxidase N-terminal domain-containing protein [Paenibacillus wulumuqiensis]|uniref:copper amine oxidase N-terminal domain-containing protein n=1 Tax=Paenibacillus wulumuqiensis TaxID=1567107 RepID=UPI002D1E4149|nr:copper amine oxidase N-terminal domain-containing protein [Paenibacillus wulumuqiensis]